MLIQSRSCGAKAHYRITQPGGVRSEPRQQSNSDVSACCCVGGGCSPTVFRSSSARAPSTSFWSCWRPTARSLQRRSFSTGCGRALLYANRTSRFRSPHCGEHSARIEISSVRNSAAATVSLAYLARMPLYSPAEAPGEQSRVLSSFVSAELPTIAPVRFQFELIAETHTNGDVVTVKAVRSHGLTVRYREPRNDSLTGAGNDVDALRHNQRPTKASSGRCHPRQQTGA